MRCLGLDTSCYTTSAALACDDGGFVSERRLLSVPAGARGLRQSEALFQHVRQLPLILEKLRQAGPFAPDCVCASARPLDREDSYMPVFQAGLTLGRSLACALDVPFFETSHQRGHIRAALTDAGLAPGPYLALHLSGGTTDVMLRDGDALTLLGTSLDLHAGQLVDRVGVLLGLPFPAGPALEALAGDTLARGLIPVSMRGGDCHLSGAETMLSRMIREGTLPPAQIAAETYDVLARTVLRLLDGARARTGVSQALLFGGVMSSARLREMLLSRAQKRRLPLTLRFGRRDLSGDNAVGVAFLGLERMV